MQVKRSLLPAFSIMLLLAVAGFAASHSGWVVVPSPNPNEYNVLTSISAVSANDIWAVGYQQSDDGQYDQFNLAEHWDGAQWTIVPSPNPSGGNGYLYGATAFSSSDIWAVGYASAPPTDSIPFLLHYDGTSWTQVSAPYYQNSTQNQLVSVSGVASDDVWAVGYENTDGNGETGGEGMIEHWDGTQWTQVTSPVLSGPTYLYGVVAASSKNVWAVGFHADASLNAVPLTEHWDGTSWTVVNSPNPGEVAQMYGVTSVGNQAWSVGAWGTEPGLGVGDPSTLIIKTQPGIVSAPPAK